MKRTLVQDVIKSIHHHGPNCPCKFHSFPSLGQSAAKFDPLQAKDLPSPILPKHKRLLHIPSQINFDYAFEMATSSIRFGFGVTREVGYDVQDLRAKNVCLITDGNLLSLANSPVEIVLESLSNVGVRATVFSDVEIEPTDASFKRAIHFATEGKFDAFVAVGGGSVIDTAKAANLYSTYPADFLDYVNPPIGKGLPPPGPLKPLIAIPTTAGTGSETTGVSIFDYTKLKAKTGIAHRRLKPILGIIDPNNTRTLPPEVAAASGFDVLCHALESYTAIPYIKRAPRPLTPLLRPAYQGSNPISDVWSLKALELVSKWLPIAVEDPSHDEARANVMLAAGFAGVGFGNAGVHLCHGMSYPVSGLNKKYVPSGYNVSKPLIPHGLSVILHAPAVFNFTAVSDPARHLHAAELMGADISGVRDEDSGHVLVDQILKMMQRLKVPNGLKAVGFTRDDIPALVEGTLPQHRVTKLSPRPVGEEEIAALFEASMQFY